MNHSRFDEIIDRRGTASFKWEKYRNRDILPMWVADMDFRSPDCVVEALRARVDHGVFGYSIEAPGASTAVMEWLERRFGMQIDKEWIVWLPGLVVGLNVVCRAFGTQGSRVLTQTPVYPPFLSAPHLRGRTLRTVPMTKNVAGNWEMDRDRFVTELAKRPSVFLLCSPHNPCGRLFTRKELEEIAALCAKYDVPVCSDEIHADLILDVDRKHIPFASLSSETADRSVMLCSAGKTFNIPGLNCAYAIIPNSEFRKAFSRAMEGIVPHVNSLGYYGTRAAYNEGEDWLEELLAYLRGNRDLVEKTVGEIPGLQMSHVEVTYLAWIDTRGIGVEDPYRFFLKAGVGLSNGEEFGAPGFVRLNFGCPGQTLHDALGRIRKAVSGIS